MDERREPEDETMEIPTRRRVPPKVGGVLGILSSIAQIAIGLLFVVAGFWWIFDPPEHEINPVAVLFAWGMGGFALHHGITRLTRR